MATLLTGASGLVGANLAHLLARRGIKLRLLLRERSDRRGLHGLSFDEARGDILDSPSLGRALEGIDSVFHIAGQTRVDRAAPEAFVRVNVDGVQRVLAASKAAGVRRLVHVSSIAAVGHGPLSAPATEEIAFNFEGSLPYHQSKRDGERAALAAATSTFEVVVANPTFVVGAYDVRPTTGELLLAIAGGWLPFYPTGGGNFVTAEDVALGLELLMLKGRSGQRYILGGQNLTYRDFFTQCAEEAGVHAPWIPLPDVLLSQVGRAGGWLKRWNAETLTELSQLRIPAYASSQKAQRECGYQPRPIRRGIREAYQWLQEEGVLPRDRPLSPRKWVDA